VGVVVIDDAFDSSDVATLIEVLDRLIAEDLRYSDPRRQNDDWMTFNGVPRQEAVAPNPRSTRDRPVPRGTSRLLPSVT